ADMAFTVDRQRVEHLVPAQSRHYAALLASIRPVGGLDHAGRGETERPAAGRGRLDDVERLLVRREPDAVRPLQRGDGLADHGAPGVRVVDDSAVVVALARLAEVGDPESARPVEDEVIGPAEALPLAAVVERLELARLRIHALNASARVVVGLEHG